MGPERTLEAIAEAPAALAVTAGSTWLPPVTLSPAEFDGHMPRVALDPQGGAFVVWLNHDPGVNGRDRLQAVFRPPRSNFGEVNPIFDVSSGQQVAALRVARDAQGNTLVVWTRSDGSDDRVHVAFIPVGEVSAATEIISDAGQNAADPEVAFGRGGDALVFWTRFDGTNRRVQAAFRPPDGTFGPAQNISDPGQDAFEPQFAFDRAGNTIAVWTRSDGTNRRVQAAFRPAGWGFGAPMNLSEAGQHAFSPQVAVDPLGNALAIWDRSDGTNRRVQAAFRASDRSFGPAQTISEPGQDAFSPRVVFNSLGNATAVWRRFDGTNVVLQAAFRPAGGSFGAAQTISEPGQRGEPQLAVDPPSNAVAVWEHSDGPDNRIQAAVRLADKPFAAPDTISEAGEEVSEPQLAVNGGGALVIWQRSNGTSHRVQAAVQVAAQTISAADQDASEPRLAIDT